MRGLSRPSFLGALGALTMLSVSSCAMRAFRSLPPLPRYSSAAFETAFIMQRTALGTIKPFVPAPFSAGDSLTYIAPDSSVQTIVWASAGTCTIAPSHGGITSITITQGGRAQLLSLPLQQRVSRNP